MSLATGIVKWAHRCADGDKNSVINFWKSSLAVYIDRHKMPFESVIPFLEISSKKV